MRTIGLLGGMSWESTTTYYRLLNEGVRDRLGGLHSAELILRSLDFAPIAKWQAEGRWEEAGALLAKEASRLASAGAEAIVLCTNTMHKLAPTIEDAVSIPLLHIGDATAEAAVGAGVRRPLLLATRFTMEDAFLRDRLAVRGVDAMVPDASGRVRVHDVIYDELCRGVVRDESRRDYVEIVDHAVREGADGLIFGCTEVGLLLSPHDVPVPALDTTAIHAKSAIAFMLDGDAQ